MPLTYRERNGSPLTWAQVDDNFRTLSQEKVDTRTGYALSQENFSPTDKQRLDEIPENLDFRLSAAEESSAQAELDAGEANRKSSLVLAPDEPSKGPGAIPYDEQLDYLEDSVGSELKKCSQLLKIGYRFAATVADAIALLPVKSGPIYIVQTKAGSGGGGSYYIDVSDTTTPVDNGTVFSIPSGGRLKLVDARAVATVHHFGAIGDGSTNDQAAVQACINWATTWNGVVRCPGSNYNIASGVSVQSSTFRSIKFQGNGTGDAQTASSGGTTFIISGTATAITAYFNYFVNENIQIDGINFYSNAQSQTNGGCAVKIIRGPANGRYISGFRFSNVGILGFSVGFWWQGMNTASSANNYIGSTTYQNVTITSTGMGHLQQNCCMNLLSFNSTVMLGCKSGAIVCQRDGDVGIGNGLGSLIFATLSAKSHLEGCAGMFRTDTTIVLDSGVPVRSSITLIDFTHESCGQVVDPAVIGDPWALGVNTDIHVIGNVVDGISYGEQVLPYLNSTARLWCDSRMRVVVNGGKIMTPMNVNAPLIHRVIANGANTVINIPIAESTAYGIKSMLLLANGNGGVVESVHYGQSGGSPTRTQIVSSIAAGITLTWGTASGPNMIQLTIANASGFTYTADLQIENLSSASILIPSEY